MLFELKYVKYITKYITIAPGSEFRCLLNFDLKYLVEQITNYTQRRTPDFYVCFFYTLAIPGF